MPYPRQLSITNTAVSWNDTEYAEKMAHCIAWIESLGVSVSPRGRHRQYYLKLQRCADLELSSSLPRPSQTSDPSILTARYETHELDRIVRHFHDNPPEGIGRKLRDIVSGPYNFYDERPGHGASSQARNTTTELFAGAHFKKHGMNIRYGDDSYPEPMIMMPSGNIATQCKRLSSNSARAVSRNLHNAIRQIETNINNGHDCISGLVFLDISKLVCPTGFVVVGSQNSPRQNNIGRERVKDFMYNHVLPINLRNHPLIDGILVRAGFFLNDPNDAFHIDTYVNQTMGKESVNGSSVLAAIDNGRSPSLNVAGGYPTSSNTSLVAD